MLRRSVLPKSSRLGAGHAQIQDLAAKGYGISYTQLDTIMRLPARRTYWASALWARLTGRNC